MFPYLGVGRVGREFWDIMKFGLLFFFYRVVVTSTRFFCLFHLGNTGVCRSHSKCIACLVLGQNLAGILN